MLPHGVIMSSTQPTAELAAQMKHVNHAARARMSASPDGTERQGHTGQSRVQRAVSASAGDHLKVEWKTVCLVT